LEPGHAFVGEPITDISEKEAASGLGVEEDLMFGGGELEVAINVTGFAEAEVKDLLFLVLRGSGEHGIRAEAKSYGQSLPHFESAGRSPSRNLNSSNFGQITNYISGNNGPQFGRLPCKCK
jgi:hypothetical protein